MEEGIEVGGPQISPGVTSVAYGESKKQNTYLLRKVVSLWQFLGPHCILNGSFLSPNPRYKKYGTRCSSCWLVPRKNVQPKRLCGRCGVSLDPIQEG